MTDALNEVPIPASMSERWQDNHPRCPECGFQPWRGHHPRCSEAPVEIQVAYSKAKDHPSWWSYNAQDRHYREQAREEGCTCRDLPAHVHRVECPLYRPAEEWLAHLDQEHDDDAV